MTAYLAFTQRGCALAQKLREVLGGEVSYGVPLAEWTSRAFAEERSLIFVGAVGIAVRAVAPHLKSKATDPAVVAVDELGRFAVPLVSGHLGGANALARKIAAVTGGTAVITTATDLHGVFAVDEWARVQGLGVDDPGKIKAVSRKALAGETVRVWSAFPIEGESPQGVALTQGEADVWVDVMPHPGLTLIPTVLALGVGCRKGVLRETLEARFSALGIFPAAILGVASIDLKREEEGLLSFCACHGWHPVFYGAEELSALPGEFTPSAFVEGVTGVDNVCERAAVKLAGGPVFLPKTPGEGVTLALALGKCSLDWRWQDG